MVAVILSHRNATLGVLTGRPKLRLAVPKAPGPLSRPHMASRGSGVRRQAAGLCLLFYKKFQQGDLKWKKREIIELMT